jgi:hypothetical protein
MGKRQEIRVTACPPPSYSQQPSSSSDDESGGCIVGRWVVALVLGLALFLFIVAECIPGAGTAVGIAAGATLAAGLLLLAVWYLLCGSKCGLLILIWEVFAVGTIVAVYLSQCCPLALGLMIAFGAVAIIMFFVWIQTCNPALCKVLLELMGTFVTGAATAIDWLTNVASVCGASWVPAAVGSIAAVLLGVYAVKCIQSDKSTASAGAPVAQVLFDRGRGTAHSSSRRECWVCGQVSRVYTRLSTKA